MNILLVSSEVVPFAKTGGLADVAGALPRALKELGHDVRVAMPHYRSVKEKSFPIETLFNEVIVYFDSPHTGSVSQSVFPETDIPVYFIGHDKFFDRPELYGEEGKDYPDNALRFAFFSMATLWMLKGLKWKPDIIHCNDWQTALIPLYLKTLPAVRQDEFHREIKVVFTVHNLGYQGAFDPAVLPKIGLGLEVFNMDVLEFYGKANLMKAGLVFADAITTVSKQYAKEIQTSEFGYGLEGLLKKRSKDLYGILNGIDYEVWSPEEDKLIPARYTVNDLSGKRICKKQLQKQNNLPDSPDIPIIGVISRLADQKGFDLLVKIMDDIMKLDCQFVLLGTGSPDYHAMFEKVAKEFPEKTGINLTFDNRLAHLIEAGSDMFLMPSRYEPCGLNQMYSLKYGTVPIVRKTGGLADTIIDVKEKAIADSSGTGFVFEKYDEHALLKTITRAVAMYHKDTSKWQKIIHNGMKKDYSWTKSAKEYTALYEKMIHHTRAE